jgi:CubicO group peptidase (beta-lactamase class C family)
MATRPAAARILHAHVKEAAMAAIDYLANSPEEVGISSAKLEAVFARAKRDVDDGVLPSAQVAVARHGKLAGVRTYGKVNRDSRYSAR